MTRIFRSIARHPWPWLLGLGLTTLLALLQLVDLRTGELRVRLDASTERMLPEEDAGKGYYDHIRTLFGSDETMVVALHADDLFTRPNLERVERMTRRIRQVPGVRDVTSLTTATNVVGSESGIDLSPFVPDPIPEDPAALAEIRGALLENPITEGSLLSRDGDTTALVVSFLITDREFVERGIDQQIASIAREEEADGAEIWLAGGPHVRVAQIRAQIADLARSIPLIVLVLGVVLIFAFRTTRGVVLPLAAIVISMVWTLATAVALGRELNIVTSLVPPLLMILGLSYSVHVLSGYYDTLRSEPGLGNADAVEETLSHMWLPVLLTGLTTMAGFVALVLSPMRAVAETGWLSVIGVLYTMIASLILVPAALSVLGPPRRGRDRLAAPSEDVFSRFAERAGEFAVSHRQKILIAAALIFALAVTAVTQIRVGTDFLDAFPAGSPIRRDFDSVNRELEGANQFNVIVTAEQEGQLLDPANLREIDRLQHWLAERPEIGGTTSVVDFQRLLNRALHGGAPEAAVIPTDRRLAAQLAAFGGEELERHLDVTQRVANITVRANVMDTVVMGDLIREIDVRLAELPDGLEGRVTGNAVLLNQVVDDLLRGQAQSVLGALVLIYGLMVLLFSGDFRTAFQALIPNVLPIAVYFGALGLSGISLNPSTSLIAPMALGIAIDDTIHYFARFSEDAKRLADERRATIAALRSVGRPVTYTGAAICLGFLMLTTSELSNFVEVGALASFTLAFGWLCEFTLTPALCSGLRVVTLWDTLTYDLGEDPQHSIPLFRGLSQAQCRIVALMASVRNVPAGQILMKVGEEGRELYVVIDGKLRAWVQGDLGPIELSMMSRGATIGEVGLFEQPRSANVQVLDDARVLRITQPDMLRLRRRYPKIAAKLFWNLNEVFAERLLNTTAKLH